jgi:hypothetical protein
MLLKKSYIVPIFLIVVSSVALFFFRCGAYRLNRTVREVALRLIQVSTLSRTTGTDFRVIFNERYLTIDTFDEDSKDWQKYKRWPYLKGVTCSLQGWAFIFSNGTFKEYSSSNWRGKAPKYVMVEFLLKSTSKKKEIIFNRDGNWRVLR